LWASNTGAADVRFINTGNKGITIKHCADVCGIKIAVDFLMKILTLFLALFLTLLPESVPSVNLSQGQDVCLEVVDDVEEEAVIRLPQRIPKKILTTSEAFSPEVKPVSIHNLTFHLIHFRFERQWLKACMLRL
jgi:hypothetical protein